MMFSNELSIQATWFIRYKGPEESKCGNNTLSTTPRLLPHYLHIIRNHDHIPRYMEPRQIRKKTHGLVISWVSKPAYMKPVKLHRTLIAN
jgi:hypothetical protein